MAAAAARPFVGSDLPVFGHAFRAPNAPALVEPGNLDVLVDALEPLLADVASASALGESARTAIVELLSYRAAAERLAWVWSALAERSRLDKAV